MWVLKFNIYIKYKKPNMIHIKKFDSFYESVILDRPTKKTKPTVNITEATPLNIVDRLERVVSTNKTSIKKLLKL